MYHSLRRRFASTTTSFNIPSNAPIIVRTPLIYTNGTPNGGIHVLALNSPPVNALNSEVLYALAAEIRAANEDKTCKGLILASSSSASVGATTTSPLLPPVRPFSAGLDVREMAGASDETFKRFWNGLQEVFITMWPSAVPIIAAIDGPAPAGGCWLGLLSDARILADDPKCVIGLNEVALGIVAPRWFAHPLERVVGVRKAEEMLSEGRLLIPSEALKYGLVDELAPRGGSVLDAAALRVARLANVPSRARAATKLLLRGPLLNETLSTPALRATDLQETWKILGNKDVQRGLNLYMAALASRGATK
jgi:3,2-trans-enoyl-CoA isomerase